MTGFRCTAASLSRGEDLAGTASTVRAFLLVQNDGPWGVEALSDARMDPDALAGLRSAAAATGVRVLLARRFGRRLEPSGLRVVAANAHPVHPWAEQTWLADSADLADLDLTALAEGRSLGLTPVSEPVLAVCTHGRHDTCCAEQGRPVAEALTAVRPEQTWECSHMGGDRYAANLLVLPYGLYYGRLDPRSAVRVADEIADGRVELDHLRGRSSFGTAVQVAEIAVRRHLGLTELGGLRLVRRSRRGEVTITTWSVEGSAVEIEVQIRTTLGAEQLLTCRAVRTNPVPQHEVVAVTPA